MEEKFVTRERAERESREGPDSVVDMLFLPLDLLAAMGRYSSEPWPFRIFLGSAVISAPLLGTFVRVWPLVAYSVFMLVCVRLLSRRYVKAFYLRMETVSVIMHVQIVTIWVICGLSTGFICHGFTVAVELFDRFALHLLIR